jgi:ABC-type amino acid transport substrate-binding protein
LAEELAADLGLEMQIVWVDSEAEALDYVLDGRSDITLGRPARGSREAPDGAAFTLPASIASGHLVVRSEDDLADPDGLRGRRVAVRESSPFLPDVLSLLETVDFVVDTVPEAVHPEEMIHRVAMGRYDVGVVESDVVCPTRCGRRPWSEPPPRSCSGLSTSSWCA